MDPKGIWIIGAGKFGAVAVEKLSKRYHGSCLSIIDVDQDKLAPFTSRIRTINAEAVQWMIEHVDTLDIWDMIIPAIPIHVAFEWIVNHSADRIHLSPVSVPGTVLDMLPNPLIMEKGLIFVSNADFICPENCPEPAEICTHTGKARPRDLYHFLSTIRMRNVEPVVLVSTQMAPGVGGFSVKSLIETRDRLVHAQKGIIVMFATACRCHGVINLFRIP